MKLACCLQETGIQNRMRTIRKSALPDRLGSTHIQWKLLKVWGFVMRPDWIQCPEGKRILRAFSYNNNNKNTNNNSIKKNNNNINNNNINNNNNNVNNSNICRSSATDTLNFMWYCMIKRCNFIFRIQFQYYTNLDCTTFGSATFIIYIAADREPSWTILFFRFFFTYLITPRYRHVVDNPRIRWQNKIQRNKKNQKKTN